MESQPAAEERAQPTASLVEHLRNGERHWPWKMGLRSILVILDIVGIGVLAWLTSVTYGPAIIENPYIDWFDYFSLPFALAVLALSLIWCLVCILVPLLRHTHRPVHPGTAVSFDLLLWLALIVTALFTVASVYSTVDFGYGGVIQDYSASGGEYSGEYKLAANGTWVYHITSVYSSGGTYHYNYTTGNYTYYTPPNNNVKRECEPYFATCAAQDAFVNRLWRQRGTREGTEITGAAVQWLGVLLHFTLFVWACVDVHRRNSAVKNRELQGVADRLLRDMQTRGMITVHDQSLLGRMGTGQEMSGARPEMREGEAGSSRVQEQEHQPPPPQEPRTIPD